MTEMSGAYVGIVERFKPANPRVLLKLMRTVAYPPHCGRWSAGVHSEEAGVLRATAI